MEKDRPRDVEVIAQRVEAVELVHAVGHGVRERILLRVDGAGGDHLAWVRSRRMGAAPSNSNVRACTLLGSTRILKPARSAGMRTSRTRFETCRKPFSNQPSTR